MVTRKVRECRQHDTSMIRSIAGLAGATRDGLTKVLQQVGSDRTCIRVIALLLFVDVLCLLLHVAELRLLRDAYNDGDTIWILRLDADRSVSEWWGYIKLVACIALLIALGRRDRQPIIGALILAFAFLLLDDSLSLHETLGRRLAASDALPVDQSAGEIVMFVIEGLILLPMMLLGLIYSDREAAGLGILIGLVLALLVVFGVLVDAIHSLVEDAGARGAGYLTIVEDWGELLTVTLAVSILFAWRQASLRGG